MKILHSYIENLKKQLDALPLDEVENGHKILSLAGIMEGNYLFAEMVAAQGMPFIWPMTSYMAYRPIIHLQWGLQL